MNKPVKNKTLLSLFRQFPFPIISGQPDETILNNIVSDSRLIQDGNLFVATRGENLDAHKFIPQAVQRGCAAVIGMESKVKLDIPYIQVGNSRQALAYLSAAFYSFPARKLVMIGVTGTDGKTTTCSLIYEILKSAGIKTGMITTLNAVIGDQFLDTGYHVTTPDSTEIQKYLSLMVEKGITHVILETTSHGWAQYRVDACEFDIGVITNITHEHLDEHGTYENYVAAKGRLLESLFDTKTKKTGNPRLAVLNADDKSIEFLKPFVKTSYCTYGFESPADIYVEKDSLQDEKVDFIVHGPEWKTHVSSNLVGFYNISNCLAALAATVVGIGVDPQKASVGIRNLKYIPGRLEIIDLGQDFTAIVDFAHTPNALERVLRTVRSLTTERVIVIVGSAGLRDKAKRRMMAEVAVTNADFSIFTAEDPRTESLTDILLDMAAGAKAINSKEGINFNIIPDRRDAIRLGVSMANQGDLVIACGKGHEQSMCFGTIEYPWDDRTALKAAISEIRNIPGPSMPLLPPQKN
jgi:UDP-N-acetylmuramoyl-L-alanyl-D-glutamate--2,6-diaminopimelate ligase